jgi:glutamine amidotransferase
LPTIVILDYGVGNLRSIQKALERVQADVVTSKTEASIAKADALVLPGVGAFRDAITNTDPIKAVLHDQIRQQKPLLGICLGLQLLFTESTEGGLFRGLDVLHGRVVRFPERYKVPHMGWNTVKLVDATNPLVDGLPDEQYMYFANSYYAKVDETNQVIAVTKYYVDFPSIVAKDNVFATQFHPEKSGKAGLQLLQNFVNHVRK